MTKFQVALIVVMALTVRLGYHQLVPAFDGSYHNGSDSGKYITRALSIVEHGSVVSLVGEGGDVLVGVVDGEPHPDLGRMPFYPHFIATIFRRKGLSCRGNCRAGADQLVHPRSHWSHWWCFFPTMDYAGGSVRLLLAFIRCLRIIRFDR